ncbi:hypothetical protein FHU29_002886 [Hoyosella altamirensis]|uniref:Uncharacterized protein n=1 Tax=Hoyosella altamirensis TaxID=616997 RepID=A0A839RPU1_9ACTN|nr:hypothetical protein [Hoyosella altamirensis]
MYGFGELVPQSIPDSDKLSRVQEIREQMAQLQDELNQLLREVRGGR